MRRLVVAVVMLALAGCTGAPATTSTALPAPPDVPTTTLPLGDTTPSLVPVADFYTPPDPLPEGEPGSIIRTEPLPAPAGARATKVLYRSTGLDGRGIAVSGWVIVPDGAGPHRVLAFAHGTTGIADDCSPTRTGATSPALFGEFVDAGWTVAFTDYQGLGTPGVHHYLVAEAEARSLLDAARAARELDPFATDEVALYGFSQGGHAALAAAERAADYAPELEVVGTVSVAPAVLLAEWWEERSIDSVGYYALMAYGYADAYGVPLEDVFSESGVPVVDAVEDGCVLDVLASGASVGIDAFHPEQALLSERLPENEPLVDHSVGPVLLVAGGRDQLFTPPLFERYESLLCDAGVRLATAWIEDASHVQLGSLSRAPALEWLQGGAPTIACR